MPREDAIDQMSRAKSDARARVDAAVTAIIALCWDFRSPDFSFSGHLALQREANKILADMSDGILSDSERRARLALAEAELQDYEEESVDYAESRSAGESVLTRLDRQADHLRDLLAGWIAVAAFVGLSKEQTRQSFWMFIKDPVASPDWRAAGMRRPSWGKGFPLDILSGVTVIEQDMINHAFQHARVQMFKSKGAVGYRTIRQSNYQCPFCDDMTLMVWPLDVVVLPYHPRCVCKAVPVYKMEDDD